MGGIETARWKPRRTKGTVIHTTRNHFACVVIAAGAAFFATFYSVVSYIGGDNLKQRLRKDFFERTEEEVDRRNLMRFSLISPKRGDTIRKLLEEEKEDQARNENIMSSCNKYKLFTTECSGQNTFIEIDDEQSEDPQKESNVHNSRKRSISVHAVCSGAAPKMPKLRKKISKDSGVISHFMNTYKPKDDDFEETRHINVFKTKQTKVQRAVKKTKVPNKPKNQTDIRKLFKKHKNDFDVLHKVSKDHSASKQIEPKKLHMGLAMSRSLVHQECSSSAPSSTEILTNSESCSITLEERRIVGIRTSLEQFGFRCKNRYTDYDLNVIVGAECKNVKKIKHKRATNLQRTTKNELVDFIDRQTNTIFPIEMITLSNGNDALYPSITVQSYLSNLFWMAQTEQTSNKLFVKYYVPELLEVNPAPVGCLLKDWSKISGREKTPERNCCSKIMDLNLPMSQVCS